MALLLQLTQKLAHGFSTAWAMWPRKEAKKDAEKAWNQKVTTPDTEDKVFESFKWQIPMLLERDPQYRPLFASWLRGERWEDEQPAPPKPKIAPPMLTRFSVQGPQEVTPLSEAQRARQAEIKAEWGQS